MTSIRPITAHDVDAIQRFASDPALAATSNLPHPYPEHGAREWLRGVSRGIHEGCQVVFAITAGQSFVGVTSLNGIDRETCSASLDYWVAAAFWGRGHGTAAAELALVYARSVLQLHRVGSLCLKRNMASRRVLEKCGFSCVGEAAYAGPHPDRFGGETVLRYRLLLTEPEPMDDATRLPSATD